MAGTGRDTAADQDGDLTSLPRSSSRSRAGLVVGVVAVLAVGAVAGWTLRTLLAPPPDVLAAPDYTVVTAQEGTVGRSFQLNVSARWTPEAVLAGQAVGVVTSRELADGDTVRAGDVLLTVDLRPVVAAEGPVPAFRDLASGVRGEDVAQLQRMLADLGYYGGPVDGIFGGGVDAAVRAWQRDLGVEPDGLVQRGDIVFVPRLPARLALDPALTVGMGLTGGESMVQVLPQSPVLTIFLPEGQAQLVAPGVAVEIPREGGGVWQAVIAEVRREGEAGVPVAVLVGVGDEPICGDECDEVPIVEETLLPSVIHVVPEVSGVTVPAAAVVTTAEGDTAVVLESGELRPVTVVASASGVAVVEGLEVGERVRAPGALPSADGDEDR